MEQRHRFSFAFHSLSRFARDSSVDSFKSLTRHGRTIRQNTASALLAGNQQRRSLSLPERVHGYRVLPWPGLALASHIQFQPLAGCSVVGTFGRATHARSILSIVDVRRFLRGYCCCACMHACFVPALSSNRVSDVRLRVRASAKSSASRKPGFRIIIQRLMSRYDTRVTILVIRFSLFSITSPRTSFVGDRRYSRKVIQQVY